MKYKVERMWFIHNYSTGRPNVGGGGCWTVKFRKHWWNKWRYVTYEEDNMTRQFKSVHEAEEYIKQLEG